MVGPLEPDAATPMGVPPALAKLTLNQDQIKPIDPKTGQPKRGRGRPPGAKNKPKDVDRDSAAKIVGSRPPAQPTEPDDKDKKAQDAAEQRKARADYYADKIKNDLNDSVLLFLVSASGGAITMEMLYKEGHVPAGTETNPHLTKMGNAIAIPPNVAKSWGKLIASLETTDVGKNLSKATENSTAALIFAGLTAAWSTYQYMQQLQPVIERLQQVRQAAADLKRQQEQAKEQGQNDGTT